MGYSIGEIVFQTQEIVLREFAFPRQLLHDGLRTFNTIPLHVADGVEYEIVLPQNLHISEKSATFVP
jgi:hypothetical protein